MTSVLLEKTYLFELNVAHNFARKMMAQYFTKICPTNQIGFAMNIVFNVFKRCEFVCIPWKGRCWILDYFHLSVKSKWYHEVTINRFEICFGRCSLIHRHIYYVYLEQL
jgi:hypothetical protein